MAEWDSGMCSMHGVKGQVTAAVSRKQLQVNIHYPNKHHNEFPFDLCQINKLRAGVMNLY